MAEAQEILPPFPLKSDIDMITPRVPGFKHHASLFPSDKL